LWYILKTGIKGMHVRDCRVSVSYPAMGSLCYPFAARNFLNNQLEDFSSLALVLTFLQSFWTCEDFNSPKILKFVNFY